MMCSVLAFCASCIATCGRDGSGTYGGPYSDNGLPIYFIDHLQMRDCYSEKGPNVIMKFEGAIKVSACNNDHCNSMMDTPIPCP